VKEAHGHAMGMAWAWWKLCVLSSAMA